LATDAEGLNGLGAYYNILYAFSNYAFAWTQVNLPYTGYQYSALAVSGESNMFLVAAGPTLYASNDPLTITSWIQIFTTTIVGFLITDVAVNTNGSCIVIVGTVAPYAYISTNSGQAFTTISGFASIVPSSGLSSVTMDSTGNSIAITTYAGFVYVSTNGGSTFTSTQVLTTSLSSAIIAGSAANQNQYLYLTPYSQSQFITSIMSNAEQGSTTAWISNEVNPAGVAPSDIAVSANGQIVVFATQTAVFLNQNYGNPNDWIVIFEGGLINSVAISSTGSNIYIGSTYEVYIYHNGKFMPSFDP
jgi:hypothetical protein